MSPRYTNEDAERIGLLADAVLERIASRHGMEFSELISLAQWTKEQREKKAKLTASAYFALVGSLIAAAAAVMWEGLKLWIHRP